MPYFSGSAQRSEIRPDSRRRLPDRAAQHCGADSALVAHAAALLSTSCYRGDCRIWAKRRGYRCGVARYLADDDDPVHRVRDGVFGDFFDCTARGGQIARAASSASCCAAAPFMARKTPPGCTKGRASSARTGSRATARETATPQYVSRQPETYSSARAATHCACNPRAGRTSSRSQPMRFAVLSSRVRSRFRLGDQQRECREIRAPQPMSMTFLPPKSASCKRARQSSKCSCATASGSVMAVRFITRFFSSSMVPYWHSCPICAGVS